MHKDGYRVTETFKVTFQQLYSAIYQHMPYSTPVQTSGFSLSSTSVQALAYALVTQTVPVQGVITMESLSHVSSTAALPNHHNCLTAEGVRVTCLADIKAQIKLACSFTVWVVVRIWFLQCWDQRPMFLCCGQQSVPSVTFP